MKNKKKLPSSQGNKKGESIMVALKIIAVLLAAYTLHDIAKSMLLLIPNRKLFRLALKHQKQDVLKFICKISANVLALIIFIIFAAQNGA